jgi:hypothetical protein
MGVMGGEHFVVTRFSKGFQAGVAQPELEASARIEAGFVGLKTGDDLVPLHQGGIARIRKTDRRKSA